MSDWIKLNPEYSTTRLVRKVAPELVEAELRAAQKPEDQFETTLFQCEGEGRKGDGGLRTKGYFKKSSDEKPLITAITVVFNGEKHLEETILSVINQTYGNVEYIIIDGGSTDSTLDIIQRYEHVIDYWVSEKDKGIYDAMNKGIRLAHGDYVGLINSDDYFVDDNVIQDYVKAFTATFCDIYHSKMKVLYPNGRAKKITPKHHSELIHGMCIFHPTCFVRKEVYKVKRYCDRFRTTADYEFLLWCFRKKCTFEFMNRESVVFSAEGITGRPNLGDFEAFEVYRENFGFCRAVVMYLKDVIPKLIFTPLKIVLIKLNKY